MGKHLKWAGMTTMSVLAAWAIAGPWPQELSAQSPSRDAAGQESAASDRDRDQALKALKALMTTVWGLVKDGRMDEAISTAEQALSTSQATYGAEHRMTAEHMLLLGHLCVLSQQYERAEELLQGAIGIFEQQGGAQDFGVARGLVALSRSYRNQGKLDEAEDTWQRAEQIGRANPLFWEQLKAQQQQPQGPR